MSSSYEIIKSMKKLFRKLCTTVFATASLLTYADEMDVFRHNPSSSIPPVFNEGSLAIPQGITKTSDIRVHIFPHTLTNDWRHGVPDDASRVRVEAVDEITFKSGSTSFKAKSVEFNISTSKIIAKFANKNLTLNSPVHFESRNDTKNPIKILRFKNEAKSNSYIGKFEIYTNEEKLNIVTTIDLENYLLGVVPSESVPTWPLEALKAQALAARSYALYHLLSSSKTKKWDVDDTARFQVYTGVSHRQAGTDKAVSETAGEVITYNKKVIVAFFHSYSGGFTDSAYNIFGSSDAPYCDKSEEIFTRDHLKENISKSSQWIVEWKKPWSKETMIKDLKNRADTKELFSKFRVSSDLQFNVTQLNENFDSINEVELIQGDQIVAMNFRKLRAALNWTNFNGYHYYLEDETPTNVTIKGYGWGHHVGMSQWGAFMMARYFDKNYKDIIHHYYHDTEITQI